MSLPLESAWLEMVSRGWGGEYGLSSQKSAIGLSSEEECVVAGGTWEALSIADILKNLQNYSSLVQSVRMTSLQYHGPFSGVPRAAYVNGIP